MTRSIRAAFGFLTRIPVGGFPYEPSEFQWAAAHFPLVGGILGALLGVLQFALAPLGPLSASILVLAAYLMLTGAFHEDGLADTSDALGGAYDRDKLREILKDSRVGTFGASALVISLAGRMVLLAQLGPRAVFALPLVLSLARVAPVWLMVAMPYATDDGRSKSRALARATLGQALVATAWSALIAALILSTGHFTLVALARAVVAIAIVGVICGYRFWVRLGGATGDFLGALEQLAELAAFAALAWPG